MIRSTPTELIWGRLALERRLITETQWHDCLGHFARNAGQVPIEEVLTRRCGISAAVLAELRALVHEAEAHEKQKPHTPPGMRPATARPAPPRAAAPPASAAAPAVRPPPPKPPPAKAPEEDGDDLELSDEELEHSVGEWTPEADDEPVQAVAEDEIAAAPAEELIETPAPTAHQAPAVPPQPSREAAPARPHSEAAPAPAHPEAAAPAPELEAPIAIAAPASDAAAADGHDPLGVEVLRQARAMGASDVHLASGSPPFFRHHGALKFTDLPRLEPLRVREMALSFMSTDQRERYLSLHDVDFSFQHRELGRFRVNALEQFRGPDIIFRLIPAEIPTLEKLGLPLSLGRFTEWNQGLVLVTGPTGSGKSTTAAALIDRINESRRDHIITIEDPIEFLHRSKGCNVTQRQVPTHTESFSTALRAALREDPDVIMIGEMRDLETISLAIRAAETGHLVIGTLHTRSAPRTIDRVIDVFPADQQAQVRTMLSESLRGVISQLLIRTADGAGRIAALEVLHVTNAVSNLIRDSKTFQLHSLMQTGRKAGMRLMDDSLQELLEAGRITREDALRAAENPKHFREEGHQPSVNRR